MLKVVLGLEAQSSLSLSKMEQRTQSWEQWRQQGIGSSDAPIIMGVSPWNTPFGLWEIKTGRGRKTESNWAMERGNELEPKARNYYQLYCDIDMPPVLAEHKEFPFLRASLDGFNSGAKKVLEIKCPGKEDHQRALNKEIPEKYIWQLVHQLMVADADVADYLSFDGERGVILPFHRDLKLEKNLMEAEFRFWEQVQKDAPPELSNKDFRELKDQKFLALFRRWKEAKQSFDQIEATLEQIRSEVIAEVKLPRVRCDGVQFMQITRKGAVDYAKIPELKNIDLEKFRRKPTTAIDIRLIKKGGSDETK